MLLVVEAAAIHGYFCALITILPHQLASTSAILAAMCIVTALMVVAAIAIE